MKKKENKKSQINQIFIYLVSILIIGFVGFLVIKFVGTFTNDTSQRIDFKIYDQIEKDFNRVYTTYGAEKVLKYRVSDNVKTICFFENSNSCIENINENPEIKSQIESLASSGDTIALFDKNNQIINSKKIGPFNACFCLEIKNNYFEIIMENNKNKVFIKTLE